jgi:protein O-mannosyl-transferase
MPRPRFERTKAPFASDAKPDGGRGFWRKKLCRPGFICLCLALLTFAVYLPTAWNGFVNFDDPDYVTKNAHVQSGLKWETVVWAFESGHASNWIPLTWLSHALDCQVFGMRAGAMHLVSAGFHVVNTVLLFLVLRALTGALWRSALVAALFALHPLHVESVAWASERKDVLSGLFFLLTIWAYGRYAGKSRVLSPESRVLSPESRVLSPESRVLSPESRVRSPQSTVHSQQPAVRASRFTFHVSLFYLLSLLFFSLGLMSKPMLVTMPFVLLLLDYWPLGRLRLKTQDPRLKTFGSLLLEKVPFFALSVASSVVTFRVQRASRAGSTALPVWERIANAVVSYGRYIRKMFWPNDLSVLYPHPGHWPLWQVLVCVALLVGICVIVAVLGRRRRYLVTGWLWFLGTMVPVIGLVQVGIQSMADRYSYLPLIGLFLMGVWGAYDCAVHWRLRTATLVIASVLAIGCGSIVTWRQIGYWRDSKALFAHALAVTGDDPLLQNNLGTAFSENSQWDEAIPYFQHALALQPNHALARGNLGVALANEGRWDEAIIQLEQAISLRPEFPLAQCMLGASLFQKGRLDEAISHLELAVKLQPDYVLARRNLGVALGTKGRPEEAIGMLQQSLKLQPDDAESRYDLAVLLAGSGRADEAIMQYQEVIRLDPAHADAHNNLGALYAARARFDDAIVEFQQSLRLKPGFQKAQINLEAARAAKANPASPKQPR